MKNDGKITKPITIAKEDFAKGLVNLINEARLPFFVIESVLKDFLNEVHAAGQQQLEADKQNYQKQLRELKGNTEEKNE